MRVKPVYLHVVMVPVWSQCQRRRGREERRKVDAIGCAGLVLVRARMHVEQRPTYCVTCAVIPRHVKPRATRRAIVALTPGWPVWPQWAAAMCRRRMLEMSGESDRPETTRQSHGMSNSTQGKQQSKGIVSMQPEAASHGKVTGWHQLKCRVSASNVRKIRRKADGDRKTCG
jgi:hypothetical protein